MPDNVEPLPSRPPVRALNRNIPLWVVLALAGSFSLLVIAVLLFAIPLQLQHQADTADRDRQIAQLSGQLSDLRAQANRTNASSDCRVQANTQVLLARDARDLAENAMFQAVVSHGSQTPEAEIAAKAFTDAVRQQSVAIASYDRAVADC